MDLHEIRCSNCNALHIPNKQEQLLISSDTPFIMLSCNSCGLGFGIDRTENGSSNDLSWRCPEEGCEGFVSLVDDGEDRFYGCGETGSIWKTDADFYKAIDKIIAKYPHRKGCYKRTKRGWIPAKKEPKVIDKMISAEI